MKIIFLWRKKWTNSEENKKQICKLLINIQKVFKLKLNLVLLVQVLRIQIILLEDVQLSEIRIKVMN